MCAIFVLFSEETKDLELTFISKCISAVEKRGQFIQYSLRCFSVQISAIGNQMQIGNLQEQNGYTTFTVTTVSSHVILCIFLFIIPGITDQGLYRIVGVGSKVQNLLLQCIDKKKVSQIGLADDDCEWEVKTITSALKQYLR